MNKLIPDIKLNKEEDGFDYKKMYDNCLVDLSLDVPKPPIAMGIGYHSYKGENYLNPTFTYGEMSAIIAPQKTKKTFFKTALASSYIGGKSNNFFPTIVSCRENEKYVIDFDTEQGVYYAQRAFRRVIEMVGYPYENYLPFGLKEYTDVDRVKFIDAVINDPKFKNKIGFVFIDGIADLCMNTNDIERSREISEKLMQWNKDCHICCVIHKTFDKDKGTGHLGSFVQKKSETTIFLKTTDKDNKNSPIEVKQFDSRGAPFDTFHFNLDLETVLPKECENEW